MIVRDEAHVIQRCLDSIQPLIDHVLIVDTGSEDGTQTLIRDWLTQNALPGEVIEEPWRDFAYNRSHALACLRKRTEIDFAFIMDADDVLVLEAGFDPEAFRETLSSDCYNVELRQNTVRYRRILICRNRLVFRFRGVLHEFLEKPSDASGPGITTGFHVVSGREGSRNRDPEKYLKDARILERAVTEEEDPSMRSRYTFYLAQSYRDCGEAAKALEAYLQRAALGGWKEEVFYSFYEAARLMERLDYPAEKILQTYLEATRAQPARAEALHGASRYCRRHKEFEKGYHFARYGLKLRKPDSGLFLEDWIYDYGLLDELAVNSYWVGHYRESLETCIRLLADRKYPEHDHARILDNAFHALRKSDI